MAFTLPKIPYELDALEPHISRETLKVHHGKHHATYVETLNQLIAGTQWERKSLEQIVREAKDPAMHNSAAQAWNHEFYWKCMSPDGNAEPPDDIAEIVAAAFGDVATLKNAFQEAAVKHFGSGWAWLVERAGGLSIEATHDAGCPLEFGATPILTCDVWEHAYYLDYQNRRADYVTAWWNVVDWDAVRERLQQRGLLQASKR